MSTFRELKESYVPVPVEYHDLSPTRRLAYRRYVGTRQPTIMYVPGFFSHMELSKAVVLEMYARANGYSSLRYDQECTGRSTGDQTTIEFEHWLEDAEAMLTKLTSGPVILVASSLGCWISTLLILRHPDRIKGALFLGPGYNCLWTGYWYYYNMLPADVKQRVDSGVEHIKIKMKYGGWGLLRRDFCENTKQFEIDFDETVQVNCPVRIVHGMQDHDVPHEFSLLAMDKFATKDVEVIYRKTGGHRLMSAQDLHLINYELDRLLQHCEAVSRGQEAALPLFKSLGRHTVDTRQQPQQRLPAQSPLLTAKL